MKGITFIPQRVVYPFPPPYPHLASVQKAANKLLDRETVPFEADCVLGKTSSMASECGVHHHHGGEIYVAGGVANCTVARPTPRPSLPNQTLPLVQRHEQNPEHCSSGRRGTERPTPVTRATLG